MKKIGTVLGEIRKTKKMSLGNLSKNTGINKNVLKTLESGVQEPSKEQIKKISIGLDVPRSVVLFKCLDESDVKKDRREIFRALSPSISDVVDEMLKQK